MNLFDAIYVPDHIILMLAQDEGDAILTEAGKAYDAAPELFNVITVWGRVGAGLLDGEPNQSDAQGNRNEGRRGMALDILALIKCAQMEPVELAELIESRTKQGE